MTSKSSRPFLSMDADLLTTPLDNALAITRLCLSSAEQWTALNLTTARQALEDWGVATQAALAVSRGEQPDAAASELARQITEKALAYGRTSSELFARTQQDLTDLLSRQLAAGKPLFAIPEGWRSPFELFAESMEQMTALASQHSGASRGKSHPAGDAVSHARKAA